MNPQLPDKIFGIETEGALEKYLESSKTGQQTAPRTVTPVSTSVPNLNDYIVLEGGQHGSYSYPDLLVSTERSHYGGNWNQAHDALHQEDAYMLTIRQFVDFLQLLKSGNPVYNGNGNQIGSKEVEKVLDDIIAVRDPLRAEWLDALFNGYMTAVNSITYHKIKNNGTLEEVTEPLEECLRELRRPGIDLDKPGIDLDYWLNNATSQGLPSKNTPVGNLGYYSPLGEHVSQFHTFYKDVSLILMTRVSEHPSERGVRAAYLKK